MACSAARNEQRRPAAHCSVSWHKMQPDLLKKRVEAATSEQCVIVGVYAGDDVSQEHAYFIRDTLNGLDTDGWWFANPGSFIVAFRSSKGGAERASACKSALAQLSKETPGLGPIRLGSAEGPVRTSLAKAGHLDTPPLGNAVNRAFWEALKDAS